MGLLEQDMRYYIAVLGRERGPYNVLELREMLRTGQIKQGVSLARTTEEGAMWFPLANVPGLFSTKSWIVAIVLSVHVGWLGVDRFYVGHVGLGVLKLLTCGGVGVWWLVDIVLFALDRIRDKQGLALQH